VGEEEGGGGLWLKKGRGHKGCAMNGTGDRAIKYDTME
jgi:hypothetical protein